MLKEVTCLLEGQQELLVFCHTDDPQILGEDQPGMQVDSFGPLKKYEITKHQSDKQILPMEVDSHSTKRSFLVYAYYPNFKECRGFKSAKSATSSPFLYHELT